MSSFDSSPMNAYLIGVLAVAALAVILSAAVLTTEFVRHRHPRPERAVAPRRAVGVGSGPRPAAGP
jgi:hypothetical protein